MKPRKVEAQRKRSGREIGRDQVEEDLDSEVWSGVEWSGVEWSGVE